MEKAGTEIVERSADVVCSTLRLKQLVDDDGYDDGGYDDESLLVLVELESSEGVQQLHPPALLLSSMVREGLNVDEPMLRMKEWAVKGRL